MTGFRFEILTRMHETLWWDEVVINMERLAKVMPDANIRNFTSTGSGRWLNEILESVKVAVQELAEFLKVASPETKCEQYLLRGDPLLKLPDMDHDLQGNPILKPHWFALLEGGKFDVILQGRRVRIRLDEIKPGTN